MKRPSYMKMLILLVLSMVLDYNCEPIAESTVGSPSDTQIDNMSFQVDTTYVSGSALYAKGRVTNNGYAAANPPWYVEAQFYTDATYSTKLGGNYTSIYVPLSPGQATFWTISFSSPDVDVRSYPGFKVRDLRAIYKK